MLAMGFVEILGRIARIRRALLEVVRAAEREKPDLAIVLDYPDFHFRLARKLKELGIPVIYYIPPKVWAWRKGRLQEMRGLFSRILSILPFEEPFYRDAGVPVSYVGNPLADELPLGTSKEESRRSLGLPAGSKVLVIMPGSRPSELKMHLELMLVAASRAASSLREKLIVLLPVPETIPDEPVRERVRAVSYDRSAIEVRVTRGNSGLCLLAADAGLIKSGTSTLEAALLGCPHVIVYRTHWLTSLIYRAFVRYRGPVGLTNLVSGGTEPRPRSGYVVPEILLDAATPKVLADEVIGLFTNAEARDRMSRGMKDVRELLLKAGSSPSRVAAGAVFEMARERDAGWPRS